MPEASTTLSVIETPPRIVTTTIKPEWIRLPAPRARCPYTGLSRTSLNELVVPSEANEFRPPVRSVVRRKRGSMRGIRLISYDSLMAYLNSLAGN